jgi:hypothetical protein
VCNESAGDEELEAQADVCEVEDDETDGFTAGGQDMCGTFDLSLENSTVSVVDSCSSAQLYDAENKACGVIENTCVSGTKGTASFIPCRYGCEANACIELGVTGLSSEDYQSISEKAADSLQGETGPTIIYKTEDGGSSEYIPFLVTIVVLAIALVLVVVVVVFKRPSQNSSQPQSYPQQGAQPAY